jgi:soluble lytic murein transglycosylase-like protein
MSVQRFWFMDEVANAAAVHKLDPALVRAVVMTESSGLTHAYRYEPGYWLRYCAPNPRFAALNPRRVAASYGLMQVMFPTALDRGYPEHMEPEHLFVPQIGLEYGCRHLRFLLDRCDGVVDQALAQYNGGFVGNEKEPYRNAGYVAKVRSHLVGGLRV